MKSLAVGGGGLLILVSWSMARAQWHFSLVAGDAVWYTK